MKRYLIQRNEKNVAVMVLDPHAVVMEPTVTAEGGVKVDFQNGDQEYPLVDLKGNGFEYGYVGSGPANLAWCILCNYLGEANLTQAEWYSHPFLSWRLHHPFKEYFIAPLTQGEKKHVILEEKIDQWFKMYYPQIDLEEYKKRRDSYRDDLRLYDQLEDRLSTMEESDPEYYTLMNTWHRASESIIVFEDYLNVITGR